MTKPDGLEKRFSKRINKNAMGFMKGILQMDPSSRFTGQQCLNHPYFEGLDELMKKNELNQRKAELSRKDNSTREQSRAVPEENNGLLRVRSSTNLKRVSIENIAELEQSISLTNTPVNRAQNVIAPCIPNSSQLAERVPMQKYGKGLLLEESSDTTSQALRPRFPRDITDFNGDNRIKSELSTNEKLRKGEYEKFECESSEHEIPEEQAKIRELMALQERGGSRLGVREPILGPVSGHRATQALQDVVLGDSDNKRALSRGEVRTPVQLRGKKAAAAAAQSSSQPDSVAHTATSILHGEAHAQIGVGRRPRKAMIDDETLHRKKEKESATQPRAQMAHVIGQNSKESVLLEELYSIHDRGQPHVAALANPRQPGNPQNTITRRRRGRSDGSLESVGHSRPATRGDNTTNTDEFYNPDRAVSSRALQAGQVDEEAAREFASGLQADAPGETTSRQTSRLSPAPRW